MSPQTFSAPRFLLARLREWVFRRHSYGSGDRILMGFGLVYFDAPRLQAVIAPVPLNLLCRFVYIAYWWAVYPGRRRCYWERREQEIYERVHGADAYRIRLSFQKLVEAVESHDHASIDDAVASGRALLDREIRYDR